MKILVVDDQLVSRAKMEKILEGLGECEAVGTGELAIAAYKKAWENSAPFDLITLDISMPGIDGTEVLQVIREHQSQAGVTEEKRVKILVVTSSSDKDLVVTCIQAGCDDYVVKPINATVLTKKVKDLGFDLAVSKEIKEEKTVRDMIARTIEAFKKGDIDLPVLPRVIQEIQDVMINPNATATHVAKVVEKDVAISVKMINTANSSLYRGTQKVENVGMAVSRIGLKEAQSVVSTLANKGLYQTKNPWLKGLLEKLWLHSLTCALCAKAIAKKVTPGDAEKVFVKGLIHDVGATLLLKNLGESSNQNTKFNEHDVVNNIYEVHASFGASLLDKWGFSNDFVKAAKIHEFAKFAPETEKEILIVNLADNLAHKIGYGFFNKDLLDWSNVQSAQLLEIASDALDEIGEEVKGEVSKSATAVL